MHGICAPHVQHVVVPLTLKPRLSVFACDRNAIFLKIVASPARGKNHPCSHPRTGDVTAEKIAEKKIARNCMS